MSVTIGSNIFAAGAIRRLGDSVGAFTRAAERLGSGARINRASDDPAGLTVSSTLAQRSRVYSRASQNISDGVSLLNIADASIGQISELLTRMAELAEQSANGTLGTAQRRSLDKEYLALDQEIRRISNTTRFNGIKLFQGTPSNRGYSTIQLSSLARGISSDGRFTVSNGTTTSSTLTITDTANGTSRTINASGTSGISNAKVLSNGDVVYQGSDAGGADQLYYYSYSTGQTRQVTNSLAGGGISMWAVSSDGSQIAVSSGTQYTNGGTLQDSRTTVAGGVLSIINTSTNIVRGLSTVLDADFQELAFSHDGRYLVGNSKAITIGVNPTGSAQAYRIDLQATSLSYTQLTSIQTDNAEQLSVTDSGEVYFRSAEDITGGNPFLHNQIFAVTAPGSTRQITNLSSGPSAFTQVSRDGGYLTFLSSENITGQNTAGTDQVFRLDLTTGIYQQLSNISLPTGGISGYLGLSEDGSRYLYADSSGNMRLYDTTAGNSEFDFEVGEGSSGRIVSSVQGILGAVKGLGIYTLTSATNAKVALDQTSRNLASISQVRGILGASLSRLEAASAVVSSQNTELIAARSRIQNADIASESAELTRTSILQQVGADARAFAPKKLSGESTPKTSPIVFCLPKAP